ncbi:type II toxin-antitoxin system death-on-curing family toxin [Niallia circulans]
MISIATGHYFVDANKRTAAMATYVFLLKNNYELIVHNDELFEVVIKVAKKELEQDELAIWIMNNSQHVNNID